MRHCWIGLVLLSVGFFEISHRDAAAAFTPLYQVVDIKGDCTVQDGSGKAKVLVDGEGHAFGTTLRTPADGSLVVLLNSDNKLSISNTAVVAMGEDSPGGRLKIAGLHQGRIDVETDKEFQNENALQIVTRCVSVNVQVGGAASVEATREADLHVVVITSRNGELDASGPDFTIPILKNNDSITIACSKDREFIRLRCLAGKIGVQVKDSDGNARIVEMVPDSVIKILRKKSDSEPGVWNIVILELDPEGTIVSSTTVTEKAEELPLLGDETHAPPTPPPPTDETPPTDPTDETPPTEPTGEAPQESGAFPSTSSSTTTSTSTTTVPPDDTMTPLPPTTPPPPPPTTTKPHITPTGRL